MVYYADYLHLEKILDAQECESDKHGKPAHDELLFIITHQTFELWFKQVLFELRSVIHILDREYIPEADVFRALSEIQRVNRIMEHLAEQFTLLETMTPSAFMEFRSFLNPASGFQSKQWRTLERTLGLRDAQRVLKDYHSALSKEHAAQLIDETAGPTLFDVVERWLNKMPFMQSGEYVFWNEYQQAVKSVLDKDRADLRELAEADGSDPTVSLQQIDNNERSFEALFNETEYAALVEQGARRMSQKATLAALFISTYAKAPLLQAPYRLLDAIVELDRLVALWRYRHTMMVTRMIGLRIGTGGSSGSDYLMRTTMKQRVFDDITSLSSFLLASDAIPPLPKSIRDRLQFVNENVSAHDNEHDNNK